MCVLQRRCCDDEHQCLRRRSWPGGGRDVVCSADGFVPALHKSQKKDVREGDKASGELERESSEGEEENRR